MATLALAPRISLLDRVQEIDLLHETLAALDDTELTQEAHDALAERLIDAISGTRDKVDRTSGLLGSFEFAEAAADAELQRLTLRKKYFARQRERLEAYVLSVLTGSGLRSIEGHTSTLAWKLNPEKLIIATGTVLDAVWMRQPKTPAPEPDKDTIKRAIKAGTAIEGCRMAGSTRLVRS